MLWSVFAVLKQMIAQVLVALDSTKLEIFQSGVYS